MKFSFSTASEVLFGRGQIVSLPNHVQRFGKRILLVHGSNISRISSHLSFSSNATIVHHVTVTKEPELDSIRAEILSSRQTKPDLIIGIGGGSVLDVAKVLAAMIPAETDLLNHLELVGDGKPLTAQRLPLILIPTTSGTGAEVTRNAVIDVPEHGRKVSLRDNRLLPDLALIDPALTDETPKNITLAAGLDAITQVIEPYISLKANPMTDLLCQDAIPKGLQALKVLMEQEQEQARDTLSWVSLCGGLALANSGLGVVHGIAGPLGGLTGAAHGALCGALLPICLDANKKRVTDPQTAKRIKQVQDWIAEAFNVESSEAIPHFRSWIMNNGLTGLSDLGVNRNHIVQAAISAVSSSSMQANPVKLSERELQNIMHASM